MLPWWKGLNLGLSRVVCCGGARKSKNPRMKMGPFLQMWSPMSRTIPKMSVWIYFPCSSEFQHALSLSPIVCEIWSPPMVKRDFRCMPLAKNWGTWSKTSRLSENVQHCKNNIGTKWSGIKTTTSPKPRKKMWHKQHPSLGRWLTVLSWYWPATRFRGGYLPTGLPIRPKHG